jgi:PAS domain S-box-containing protein
MNQTLQASEFVLRTQNRELSGRMRELNCLFELGKVIASSNASLDQVFEKSMTILTEAVQYPQLACVRITFEDQGFSTANFHDTEWSMEATISQGDRVYGQIVVCYLQKPADMSGSAFLTEENALLSSFAAQLAQLIERHKAEQTLQENESRFRTLVANVPGAVYRALPDSDRTMNYISQAIVDIAGYAPADFMSGGTRTYMSIVHPDDTEMVLQSIRQASQEGLPYAIEYRLIHSDGWLRWVYDKGHCVHDGHRLMWLDGAVFDITNRKNTEDTLTRQKDLLGNILSTIPLFVSWKDRNLTYMGCNDAMARAAGYSSPQDIIGKTDIDMPWTVEQVEEYQDSDRQVLSTGRPLMNMEEKQTLIDGSERTILTSKVPLRNPQSEVIGVLTIGVDITDRKLLESQLIQAQKLESIGQLASGIAHEINTPTQYIGDNVRFLRDKIADIVELLSKHTHLMERLKEQNVCADLIAEIEEETKEVGLDFLCEEIPLAINDSLDGIDRVTDIVRAMKEFSHPGVEGKAEQDLNRAIHNTITVARNRWKYVAEMETHFDPKLPSVTCLINEINQVILNLIVNAADAIADRLQGRTDERGKITVSTRHVKNKVEIRISDTGTGIPQEIRSRVFDPFFTTKEVGKGTGQGLAICHDIIKKKHGGEIFFESETGKGTTFVIRLPLDVDADKSIDTGEVDTCPKTQ